VILTVQAVEGTSMVKDGQVVMAMLGAFGDSIFGVATACAARTNKISHAVGGKRVVVIRKIALVRAAAFYGAAFHSTKPAEAHTALGDSALVHTKPAGDAGLCPGRVFRKTIRLPAAIVNSFDFRPHFLKIGPDTICAEAYYSGDRWTAFAAMTARAHAKAEYSFADAGHDLPILRIDLLTYQICKIPNPKSQITNKSQIQIFNDPNGLGPRI
jgi:hypothetical protein